MSEQPTAGNQQATPTAGSQPDTQPTAGQPEKTFKQEEVNNIVQERLASEKAKYADYDAIKAKLAKLEDENKSELEKATERATAAEAKIADYEKAGQQAKWRLEVRKEKGLPESVDSLLTGETLDEIKAKGDILKANISKTAGTFIPGDTGKVETPPGGSDLKEFFKNIVGG